MDPQRWQQVEALYHSALECASSERVAYVAGHCGADDLLRREVESLLLYEDTPSLIDKPAMEIAAVLFDAEERLAAGDEVGPFRIEGELGSGGMGVVYRARDTRLGRTVALKVCHEEFSQRFAQEARAIASLNHPHICQLYDVGPNYLVMELVEGVPLKGPLPLAEAVEYGGRRFLTRSKRRIVEASCTAIVIGICQGQTELSLPLLPTEGLLADASRRTCPLRLFSGAYLY